jgi:lipopolysaccharide export system protein LptA
MKHVSIAAALLAAALLAVGGARAQSIDLSNGGPIDITAAGGIEYRDTELLAIATRDARAVRGGTTVLADQLVARLRKKVVVAGAPRPVSTDPTDPENGGNEVYRLEAHGHVRMLTETDEAVGDDAIYDIDQAVLIMTGRNLKLTTPQQVLTARDQIEYWSDRHMGVGRGNAVVVTTDQRRLAGDVLVAFTADDTAAPAPGKTVPVKASPPAKPASGSDPLTSGKLQRIEAYGNVEVRTISDIARGDRGLYLAETDIARLVGHVRVTHAGNQLNGPAADVNMKTGIARIISDPTTRVSGQLVPNSGSGTTPNGANKPK